MPYPTSMLYFPGPGEVPPPRFLRFKNGILRVRPSAIPVCGAAPPVKIPDPTDAPRPRHEHTYLRVIHEPDPQSLVPLHFDCPPPTPIPTAAQRDSPPHTQVDLSPIGSIRFVGLLSAYE